MDESTQDAAVNTHSPQLTSEESVPGPRGTKSLSQRRVPLASPAAQIHTLDSVDLAASPHGGDFNRALVAHGWEGLSPLPTQIFQINIGKLCNMVCLHCHVDSGPDRTHENMDLDTIDACLAALARTNATVVDITGGAPELNPHFKYLVDECISRGKHVMDRCNLTVLMLPRFSDLPRWLAERGVEVVCSLPHFRKPGTDAQRGDGTFDKSIEALLLLNDAGYGMGDPSRRLTLVTNPVGSFLSGNQGSMEREWKERLSSDYGVRFDALHTINNSPIARYLEWLIDSGNLEEYMELLVNSFNPSTVGGLMCRNTLSVSWDGKIYDCDFNQMLELGTVDGDGRPHTIFDFDPESLAKRSTVTGRHCFACTAGAGSSCGGAIE